MTEYKQLDLALKKVIGQLLDLQRPEQEKTLVDANIGEDKTIGFFPRDFGMGPWDWPQGVGLYGLWSWYEQTGDDKILNYLMTWFDDHLAKGLPRQNVNTTCPLLTLAFLADRKPEYYAACEKGAAWLVAEQPRTPEGGLQHTTTKDAAKGLLNMNEGQIWIDTLFMAVLFLAKWGAVTNNKTYLDEAVHQYLMMVKYLYEKKTGLFYHAWSFPERTNFGEVFWCRGNCWYTASIVDFLEIMGGKIDGGVRGYLLDTYRAQVKALCSYQAESGLWHTVIDDESSYEETSGSAGIVYGILKGMRLGHLSDGYRIHAEKGVRGILAQIGGDGIVGKVSAGTRVGDDKKHYAGIMIAPMAYGQSLAVMSLCEALNHKKGENVK